MEIGAAEHFEVGRDSELSSEEAQGCPRISCAAQRCVVAVQDIFAMCVCEELVLLLPTLAFFLFIFNLALTV